MNRRLCPQRHWFKTRASNFGFLAGTQKLLRPYPRAAHLAQMPQGSPQGAGLDDLERSDRTHSGSFLQTNDSTATENYLQTNESIATEKYCPHSPGQSQDTFSQIEDFSQRDHELGGDVGKRDSETAQIGLSSPEKVRALSRRRISDRGNTNSAAWSDVSRAAPESQDQEPTQPVTEQELESMLLRAVGFKLGSVLQDVILPSADMITLSQTLTSKQMEADAQRRQYEKEENDQLQQSNELVRCVCVCMENSFMTNRF